MPRTLASLWQNQDEEMSCGNLALWFLREKSSWWYLDLQLQVCCHSKVGHQKTEGIERPVEAPPFETLLDNIKLIYVTRKKRNVTVSNTNKGVVKFVHSGQTECKYAILLKN